MRVLILCLLTLALVACKEKAAAPSADAARQLSIVSSDGVRHDFEVELALTEQQQQIGLMNRTSMPENAGMLFWFGDEAERSFWMKNTLIPLDLIFIQKDGTISHIHERSIPGDLTPMVSYGPAIAVLEVNGGTAEKLNIFEGDVVHHQLLGNSLAK